MPNFAKFLAAGPLALLLLSGTASATPGEGLTAPLAADGQIEVAHYGDPATAETQPRNPERFVRIAGFVWSKAVGAMQADLTIESTLPFAIREVELVCAQFARTGVEIGTSHRTIEEIVPARGRLRIEALEIGAINPDAGSTGCRVVSVTPA